MSDIIIFLLSFGIGFLIGRHGNPSPMINESLQNKIDILENDVKYYKDLCKWHVEEKRKAQEIRDKFERESG
jgi:hypothetical protein